MRSTFMMVGLASLLISCRDSEIDPRNDWWGPTPLEWGQLGPQSGDIKWFVDQGVNERVRDQIPVIAQDWEGARACLVRFVETQQEQDADIVFRCGVPDRLGPEASSNLYAQKMSVSVSDHVEITLGNRFCNEATDIAIRHALGFSIGLTKTFQHNANIMYTGNVTHDIDMQIEGPERDTLIIDALRRGAPGCDGSPTPWSWGLNPERYRSHPSDEDLYQMINHEI